MNTQPAECELSSKPTRPWGFHDGWGQSLDRLVKWVAEGMVD
ncbi:hypothetical protein PSH76_05035 [Pseudomonas sp. FP215]|nr:hypothetical protein [Pseudomonas sp. FP215]WLH25218.1 hypothetical protein PSH76_05035 [Pseudomonas sp. FP215]